jgi:hypothetical protein
MLHWATEDGLVEVYESTEEDREKLDALLEQWLHEPLV